MLMICCSKCIHVDVCNKLKKLEILYGELNLHVQKGSSAELPSAIDMMDGDKRLKLIVESDKLLKPICDVISQVLVATCDDFV